MSENHDRHCTCGQPSRRVVMGSTAALGVAAALAEYAQAATGPKTLPAKGFAVKAKDSGFSPFAFKRRDVGPKDVLIDVLYCGVCHSDIHTAWNEWPGTHYPCVPGHEVLGRVLKVGKEVTRFKQGDIAAVGCLVDSCGHCPSCEEGLEQFCENGYTLTYDSADKTLGGYTYGGYSNLITVTEHFVVKIPEKMNPAATAPLLCAGVTTFSPMRHWKVKKGSKVGIIGIGGLGHVGVKIAAALGAEVTAITTSPGKAADAKRLGAKDAIVSTDEAAMKANANRFDFLLSTIPQHHPLMPYTNLLRRDGTLVLVGALDGEPMQVWGPPLIGQRKAVAGSVIGGLKETQEMVDFCAANGITADIEMIDGKNLDAAYKRVKAKDVRYRFVIDLGKV
ncbi:NAD(P)-dependent alcohol dehydrogenase [Rhizomicrobium electricum]|uniref:NAD(P)-dependent alcohol dehydrogenase n=1 Tax=Rhizomicrobium electricum TaxID=480070 RepID=UPI001FBAA0E8|nr:NAD(P)-dependent alcohol dehydrogenase [Rhizomicrobium electricum]NIJ50439.1 putative zinc-type alcohol dehydrogenase-like protein [Rhizomicrobium electricum]